MAIAILFGPGMSQAEYEESGFCVVEVWNSQEAAGRFFQETLGPSQQRAQIDDPER